MGSLRGAVRMYTVAKGPQAILHKTRRGINKPLEGLDCTNKPSNREENDIAREKEDKEISRIVFRQPVKMRNKRCEQENLSPEHQEIVSFVTQDWVRVKREMEQGDGSVHYYEEISNPRLSDFEPFDLDAWWGRKLYQNLTSG